VLKESNKVIGEIDAFPESGEPHSDENAVKDTIKNRGIQAALHLAFAFQFLNKFLMYIEQTSCIFAKLCLSIF